MISIAIHGGAGVISRASMTEEAERAYRADLGRALDAGYAVLESGGSSLDATVAAVRILEDSPYFNAGKGAVFNHAGINELDAAIMDARRKKRARSPACATSAIPSTSRAWSWSAPATCCSRRRRRGIRARTGHDARARQLFLHRAALEAAGGSATPGTRRQRRRGHRLLRHGRRGRARQERQPCRSDFHGRHDQQALGPHRRFADHRRRHLCRQRDLRGVRDRQRRVLHPRGRCARDLRACAALRRHRGRGREGRHSRQAHGHRRRRRRDRRRQPGRAVARVQHRGDVPGSPRFGGRREIAIY